MKKIVVLFLFLMFFTTGCSYQVTSSSSQTYRGESENWIAEYTVDFSTSFPEKDGKTYVKQKSTDHLNVTYKKDSKQLTPARHYKISYNDVEGNSSWQTEDNDKPIVKKEFHSGGGSGSTSELSVNMKEPENLSKTIKIYSGPSYEMRTSVLITVNLQIEGKSETIILKPVRNISPAEAFRARIEEKLKQMWIEKRYPQIAEVYEEQDL